MLCIVETMMARYLESYSLLYAIIRIGKKYYWFIQVRFKRLEKFKVKTT